MATPSPEVTPLVREWREVWEEMHQAEFETAFDVWVDEAVRRRQLRPDEAVVVRRWLWFVKARAGALAQLQLPDVPF